MKNFVLVFCFAVSAALANQLAAQTADDIVAAYCKAIGGKEKLAKLKTMKATMRMNYGGMIEMDAVQYAEAPNKSRVEATVQGKTVVEVFDGKTAWGINPFESGDKPVKKTPEEALIAQENEFPEALMFYKERGHKIELLGQEDVEGAKCHKIKLVHGATGGETHHFIDVENNVLLMTRSFPKSGQMKGATLETYYSDYAEHDGLMFAMSSTQKMNGETFMTISILKIEQNAKLDKKLFSFPK